MLVARLMNNVEAVVLCLSISESSLTPGSSKGLVSIDEICGFFKEATCEETGLALLILTNLI